MILVLHFSDLTVSPQVTPYLKYDIERVVQRRFTKRLQGLRNYSYADRLKLLNLSSLELRRIHSDLACCYKIVFGLTMLKFDDFFQWNSAPQNRGHPYKLYKTNSTCRARTVKDNNQDNSAKIRGN